MVATGDEAGLVATPLDAGDAHIPALTPVLVRTRATANGDASPTPTLALRLRPGKRTMRRPAPDPARQRENETRGRGLAHVQSLPHKKTTKKRARSVLRPLRPGSRRQMMLRQRELRRMVAHLGSLVPGLLRDLTRGAPVLIEPSTREQINCIVSTHVRISLCFAHKLYQLLLANCTTISCVIIRCCIYLSSPSSL